MNNLGILGESRVISELIKCKYEVFTQFSGKAPFDMVAYKDSTLYRVEVKSTRTRTKYDTGWEVQLKRSRPNRSSNIIHKFDNTSCDILAIYIEPLDEVLLIQSVEVTTTCSLSILDNDLEGPSEGWRRSPT